MSTVKALINSMRLRTLPLSLAGVVCGSILASANHSQNVWSFVLLYLTTIALQVLTNLSNEMGDHLSGVDSDDREGPNYSLAEGGLSEKQMWHAINGTVIACCLSGLAMVLVSGSPWWLLLLGAAAIWAATHYTLGKSPYGYKGLGDISVFIFFGLVSVLGGYFVIAQTIDFRLWLLAPAVGVGLLSVAVLNVNNIRDMATDQGIRRTIPLRIGERRAKWYQTVLVVVGVACFLSPFPAAFHWLFWFLWAILVVGLGLHIAIVWRAHGKFLDPALPLLVLSTFFIATVYSVVFLTIG